METTQSITRWHSRRPGNPTGAKRLDRRGAFGSALFVAGILMAAVAASPGVSLAQKFDAPQYFSHSSYRNSFWTELETDGAGVWILTWTADGLSGSDGDILFARSDDSGATWSTPVPLNTNAALDTGDDFHPSLATDGTGNWVAVWASLEDLGGLIGADSDVLVSRSSDNGVTWSPPEPLNSNAATDSTWHSDFSPSIATDSAGAWVAVWSGHATGAPSGEDRDIFVSRSTDSGVTWTPRVVLNSDAATDEGSDFVESLATDKSGNWVVVMRSKADLFGDMDLRSSRSSDNGATWSIPTFVNTTGHSDRGDDSWADLVTDGAGTWITVWQSDDPADAGLGDDDDILFARSTNSGASWTPPAPLNSTAKTDLGGYYSGDFQPRLATDGSGNWIALWLAQDAIGGRAGEDTDILVSQSTDNAFTWSPPRPIELDARTDGLYDGPGVIGTDGSGGWLAVWLSGDELLPNGEADFAIASGTLCEGPAPGGPICAATPVDDCWCLASFKSKLQIDDSADPAKDRLRWSWKNGEDFSHASLGDPTASTEYALCLYDSDASAAQLKAQWLVSPSASLWTAKASKGFRYADKAGTSSGTQKATLKPADWGKASVSLSVGGPNSALPSPHGATFFQQDEAVVAQLVSAEGTCWTSVFRVADTLENASGGFHAQMDDKYKRPKPE